MCLLEMALKQFYAGGIVVTADFVCSLYRGADKSLARPASRYILFDGENISFDACLVIYISIVLIFLQL
jgi:hypothetical protein